MSKKTKNEMPEIAWDELDIMTSIELAEQVDDLGEAQVLNAALQNGLATPEQVERLLEIRSATHQRKRMEQSFETMAKYVNSVPRSWFVSRAPEALDFDDPATYKLLRSEKFRVLYRMLTFSGSEASTGN